ncbi:phytoene desaturase family protein [Ferruginibacter sp. HRS2-29]|uniref:phytoene desaturase family protein n=1 Tax=Ferruginibacter sp. HRS2-29 TaxID=2487334 RepID=UPI0020CEB226|nr:phytoene desaturase [Ferruginibacter sp. HRS2-29]
MKKAVIIGSGFSGLSAASFLAKAGWQVTVIEKQSLPGGRARQFSAEGFTFDMGPSWYWMPDIFERYFNCFGKKVADYYQLQRLDPSYRIYWPEGFTDIPAGYEELKELFEKTEKGAAAKLDQFMSEAAYKYEVGINKLVHKPGRSLTEFIDMDLARGVLKLDVFTSMKKHVRKFFSHPKLVQLLEFPVLFLGALPEKIPALYSLMNYADIKLGTWYPQGGMYKIVEGMYRLATELGVQFRFEEEALGINIKNGKAESVTTMHRGAQQLYEADVVIGAADYHFVETKLLPEGQRSYSENYWNKRIMAPSCLLYYVGVNKKLPGLTHHSLFFDVDFDRHGKEIYDEPQWPSAPLFYVSATSVTDDSVSPAGNENLFFLIPVATGLQGDTEELRERYFDKMLTRFEAHTGHNILENIVYKRTYAVSDFVDDYNAFKGNAYGLANTLMQTAILKPSLKSKKVGNLFYTGQLTVPGPGVPPSLISGEVVAKEIIKELNLNT